MFFKRGREQGQTLVLTAVSLLVLLGCGALAVDLGYLRYVRRQMQSAVDSAAIAGATEVDYGDVQTAATADASTNGFTNDANGVTVTVNNPPLSGEHTCALDLSCADYVEVIISQAKPTFFAKIFNRNTSVVRTRAVAYGGDSGTNCIYALSPSGTSYTQSSGSASTNSNCGIMVDSSSTSAMAISGGGTVTATGITIVGAATTSGGSVISPTPTTGAIPEADPLAYLSVPSAPAAPAADSLKLCSVSNGQMKCSISGGHTSAAGTSPGPDILNPGLYSEIDLSGTSYIELNSGFYYIAGGGINSSGGSSITGTVGGTGITIYNSGPLTDPSNCKSVNVSGSGTVNLTAPESSDPSQGTIAGVMFFQNRSCTASVTFSGGSSFSITGAIYMPDAALTYSGGSIGENNYTILVANTITISGGSAVIDNDYSSLGSGNSPIHRTVLVE